MVRFLLHVDSFVYVCECHAAPASFVEKITFASLYFLCSILKDQFSSLQSLSSVWLCNPMDWSMPGFPVHHLPELALTHVHWVSDAIQPSHPLSSHFPPTFNLSKHQCLFQWVSSSHQMTKVLELQHQSFQLIVRVDFLLDWLVLSPCCPKDSQESSPTPQFKSVNSLMLSLLYGPTLTSVHDYWKNHSFDYTDLYQQSNVSAF